LCVRACGTPRGYVEGHDTEGANRVGEGGHTLMSLRAWSERLYKGKRFSYV